MTTVWAPTDADPCPECGGAWMPDHPAGWLAFRHENSCSIRASEDSRAVADKERAHPNSGHPGRGFPVLEFDREPTATELLLLDRIGYPPAAPGRTITFNTTVNSDGLRCRTWPATTTTETP